MLKRSGDTVYCVTILKKKNSWLVKEDSLSKCSMFSASLLKEIAPEKELKLYHADGIEWNGIDFSMQNRNQD